MSNKGNNKRWTAEDAAYIRQNLGKVSLKDMASYLERSPMSVRLYILRNRLTVGRTVKRNLLIELLKVKFRHPEAFCPTRTFYKETGIGQRRYWDLYFGRKSIKPEEYTTIATYLGVTIREAFESRQLELFDNTEKNDR